MKQFESPLPHNIYAPKAVPVAAFIFYPENSVKTVSKQFQYTEPEIIRAKHGWYIKYKYRLPAEIRKIHRNKIWMTFRIKKDINRFKGADKERYSTWLKDQIALSLKNGYNPFKPDAILLEEAEFPADLKEETKIMSARDALWLFLKKWNERGLDPDSYAKYKRFVGRLIEWLIEKGLHNDDVKSITQDHIEAFLQHNKKKHSLSNRESNNTFDFIRTAFNFLVKKKHIEESPCNGIDKMKANTTKHRFFDKKSLDDITKLLQVKDPYTYFAFQCVYHLCIRSDEEIQNLKVGNILWEQDKILAEFGKGKAQRYIPMDENIKKIFLEQKIDTYPGDHYVFGIKGKPSPVSIGGGFFAKRFRKIRDAAGMSSDFTIYGAKHTRVVHLKHDGVSDADIMSLTGHKDFSAYAKYLRDLGMTADVKNINKRSRKV